MFQNQIIIPNPPSFQESRLNTNCTDTRQPFPNFSLLRPLLLPLLRMFFPLFFTWSSHIFFMTLHKCLVLCGAWPDLSFHRHPLNIALNHRRVAIHIIMMFYYFIYNSVPKAWCHIEFSFLTVPSPII